MLFLSVVLILWVFWLNLYDFGDLYYFWNLNDLFDYPLWAWDFNVFRNLDYLFNNYLFHFLTLFFHVSAMWSLVITWTVTMPMSIFSFPIMESVNWPFLFTNLDIFFETIYFDLHFVVLYFKPFSFFFNLLTVFMAFLPTFQFKTHFTVGLSKIHNLISHLFDLFKQPFQIFFILHCQVGDFIHGTLFWIIRQDI